MPGVVGTYESVALGETPQPWPPGTNMPTGFPGLDLLGQVAQFLNLQSAGLFTPWATRSGGVDWEVVRQPPDTNISISVLSDQAVRAVPTVTFGQPLPFIGVVTASLPTPGQIDSMWSGTDYQAYETQAVYAQADKNPVPVIQFLHWGERRQSGGGNKNLDAAASSVGGRLVFSAQVDYRSTVQRQTPTVPFKQALANQLGTGGGTVPITYDVPPGNGGGNGAGLPVTPVETPPESKTPWLAIIGVGALAAGATFVVVRAIKKKG